MKTLLIASAPATIISIAKLETTTVHLPIRFPDDSDTIAEDGARFRKLSPAEKVREVCEMVRVYDFLAAHSSQPEASARLAEEEENCGRRAIEEFAARHG